MENHMSSLSSLSSLSSTDLSEVSLGSLIRDCVEFDTRHGLSHLHEPRMSNVAFFTLALAGEVGELANIVKKIWRDGENAELWLKFDEEVVDIMIYLMELLNTTHCPFATTWVQKQTILNERRGEHFGYNLEDRQLNLIRK